MERQKHFQEMTHNYKYESLREEDRNALIPAVRGYRRRENLHRKTAAGYKLALLAGLLFVATWIMCMAQGATVVDLDQRLNTGTDTDAIPYNDSLFIKAGPNCLDPHWTSRERAHNVIVP
jgi:hypothetical protein